MACKSIYIFSFSVKIISFSNIVGVAFNSFFCMILFPFSSLENSVLLRLERVVIFFLVFGMCFSRYCYSIYESIYRINHSKQSYGLLGQAYHILDMGTQPLGYSMGSVLPLLFCKFLNNCETDCRHTAASAKNKKTEFVVNLVSNNSFV